MVYCNNSIRQSFCPVYAIFINITHKNELGNAYIYELIT
ncbi:hypothetical protein SPPR111872_21355 [Sphingobacterium prati]